MSILWWEKTVEYFFVKKYVNLSMFIAPLDGNHEKAGDAIFSNESSWLLIEFKRDNKRIADEEKKFVNYSLAKNTLQSCAGHHLIIYGEEANRSLELRCQQYFSGEKVGIERALSSGVQKGTFVQYLRELVKLKNGSESGAGGYSFVAGVASDGSVTKCMKLSEYVEALNLEKEITKKIQKEHEFSRSRSGPSFER